jgi:hypothetical protein
MQRGIGKTPEPPRLLHAERLGSIGQMLAFISLVERLATGGMGNGGADDKIG